VISLPSEIQPDGGWNDNSGLDKNLESNMDFAEHQRIVFDALKLLAGAIAAAANAAGTTLGYLKTAAESNVVTDVLYISKGIHQPNTNPHLTLKLKRAGGHWYTYHLNLHVDDTDIAGLPQAYFHWVGVQFTAMSGASSACWPLVAVRDTKYHHPRRRMSIAPIDVQAKIEAIAEAERVERERQERIEQARVKEQGRALGRNAILAKLQAMNYTIPGNQNNGLNKLYDGESITITTKTRKSILVKYNGNNVVNA
jgi:hypothetical protein